MMNTVLLCGVEVPYQITKKDNKNTYFYFKSSGYIQVNLSKYQTKKQIISYMKEQEVRFLNKYKATLKKKETNSNAYSLLGKQYRLHVCVIDGVKIDDENNIIMIPSDIKQEESLQAFEKKQMLQILHQLIEKYRNNPYVNINNIHIQTRYTSTRHGSCNAKKRSININLNLIKYPRKFIEYVFLHEITHLKHQNH